LADFASYRLKNSSIDGLQPFSEILARATFSKKGHNQTSQHYHILLVSTPICLIFGVFVLLIDPTTNFNNTQQPLFSVAAEVIVA
jgi:hypothetical protein